MDFDLYTPVTHTDGYNYVIRNGFIFTCWGDKPHIYDVLVIRHPNNIEASVFYYPQSEHSLESHIKLINDLQIERVEIISTDLSFIKKCPSLNNLSIYPPKDFGDGYDYSPLYGLEGIEHLSCHTEYGKHQDDFSTTIDYSRIHGIKDLGVYGKGNLNYESMDTLEKLFVSRDRTHKTFAETTQSPVLKKVTFIQCGIKSMEGIENCQKLQQVDLWHCRSLEDIPQIGELESLRWLSIDACPRIKDFSFLSKLKNLEFLSLEGSNVLPDLKFLRDLPKLKMFIFTMPVADGDLTPCLDIPYARCDRGRKHYNLKDKDLPKYHDGKGFSLI